MQYTRGHHRRTAADTVLGYTRGGGFVTARIGSGEAVRIAYTGSHGVSQLAKVPVRTAGSQPVTSAHLPNVGGVVGAADGVAWGNGPNSLTAYAGPEVELECGTCHNPHGNGQYRILNPIPEPAASGIGRVRAGRRRRHRHRRGASARRRHPQLHHHPDQLNGTGTLLASQVAALALPATAGDFFRRKVPWNAASGSANDAPNGEPATFTTQISTWCTTCHSRYLSQGWDVKEDDAIFTYRHTSTNPSRNCITCHVSHGSNAQMTGTYSANMENPGRAIGVATPRSATAAF